MRSSSDALRVSAQFRLTHSRVLAQPSTLLCALRVSAQFRSTQQSARFQGSALESVAVCTRDTCTHCCACHITHRSKKG